jgi:Putative zinc-finger
MNHEIPNPLRNALVRQAVGDVHPSPDALTSFLERTLPPMENEVVTHHLAQCAECREIVFLASEAAEDEARREEELVAAASISRVAAMPAYVDASLPVAARAETPRSRWTIRMRWAVSVAAALVFVSGALVVQVWRAGRSHNAAPLTVASNRPAAASPTPESTEARQTAIAVNPQEPSAKPSVPGMPAKAAPQAVLALRTGRVPAQTTVAGSANNQSPPSPATVPASPVTNAPTAAGTVGGVSNALVSGSRPQSSFVESEAGQGLQLRQGAPALFAKSQMALHAASAVRPQWRIGPEGHLERSMVADQWTRVLDDQPVTFRAVAALGNDVWAGGNGGALFHSPDRGEHWSRVLLTANSNVESGGIVSIRFDDSQHGIVTSDSGTRWATTDGGVTWAIQ